MNERARSYRDRARSRRTQASGKESGSRSAMRMRRRQRAGAVPHSPLRGPFGQVEVARSTRHGRDGEHARRFGRRPNCRSALAGSGILLRMTTASGLSLNVTPEHGHVGDRVVLSPSGPDADHAVGGAASRLQAERDGEWVDLFHLVSWGEGAPSSVPVHGPFAVRAIGLKGPVTAVVPPVEPGRYRICRGFSVPREGERALPVSAFADLVVDP